MKKLLTSCAVLSALSTPALSKMPFNGFVGADLGFSSILWEDSLDAEYMPSTFFRFGLEGGVKWGDAKNIYNIGITAFTEATAPKALSRKTANILAVDKASFSSSIIGITADNYIRLHAAKDTSMFLVLGLGYSSTNQTLALETGGAKIDIKDDTNALVLRLGGIYNFIKNWGLAFGIKAMPYKDATFVDYGVGVRYAF